MSLAALNERIGTINDLLTTINLLVWDARTMMPPGGTAVRGRQIATLTQLARDFICDDEMLRRLESAEREVAIAGVDDNSRVAVRQVREAVDAHRRVPGDLFARRAELQANAMAVWAEARETNDFALFEPYLAKTMVLARAQADTLGWQEHPYDALVRFYEPGETLRSLRALFKVLQPSLKQILVTAQTRPRPRDVLSGHFPVEDQQALASRLASALGYDFYCGRLDPTTHPFEISFTRDDVRIATRFRTGDVTPSIFVTLHEAGHGLYEQNIDPEFTRSIFSTDILGLYAVGGASFGVHESQSRLFENHVGRGEGFWRRHYADLAAAFPIFAEVPLVDFLAAIRRVEPGLIRVEADEVTYDLHVMMRVEIEAGLIGGELAARDVPERWRQLIHDGLGLAVPSDREGCLQDMHWASGLVGSFCTYTIGNVMAAQLMAAARSSEPLVDASLERGDVAPLSKWLRDKVWRHGRRFQRDEILTMATGRKLDPAPYLQHLAGRYAS